MSKIQAIELRNTQNCFQEIQDCDSSSIIGGRGGRSREIRNLDFNINTNINITNVVPIQINVNILNQIALGNGQNIGSITSINHINNIGVNIG